MKRITFARLAVLMLAVAGLVLQGCGGDDDAYMISAEDQARIDQLTDDLADAEAELEMAESDLETANERAEDAEAMVAELQMKIGMMDDAADADGSLYAQLNAGMMALEAAQEEVREAQAQVDSLTGIIGMDPSDADPDGSGLRGQLATTGAALLAAQTEIGSLNAQIGAAPSADDPNGSGLRGMLAMANDATDAANDKVTMLEGQVAALEDQVGREPGEGDGGSGLQKELADAKADRDMYMTEANRLAGILGMMATDDAEATGLYKELADAQYEAMHLAGILGMMDNPETDANEATGLRADLMAAEMARDKYMEMVGDPSDAADPAGSLNAQINDLRAQIASLQMQLTAANNQISQLQQQQTAQTSIARGSAFQTAMLGNPVPPVDNVAGTAASTALANTARQLPFAIASTQAGPHAITYTTTGGITLANFTGATTMAAPATAVSGGTGWHTARLTRNNVPDGATFRAGTQTAVVYTDTLGVALLNNYAYFGWWEHRPTLAGNQHFVEAFAGGTDPIVAANYTATAGATNPLNVVGIATYNGIAAGKYASRQTSAGVVTGIDVGDFTANASLTANFGTNANQLSNVAGAQVSGTINQFVLSSGNPASWVVNLNQDADGLGTGTAGVPNTPGVNDTGLLTGTTTLTVGPGIQRTGNAGNWVGEFFGPRTQPVTGGVTQEIAPQTIVGTFDASDRATNPLLTIHGAFGAEN